MPTKDLAIVVLAAGKGTRLKSNLAKVLHQAGGRSLVEQVLRACAPLGAKKTVVVIGHQAEQVAAVVEPTGCEHGAAISAAWHRARDAGGAARDWRSEDCGGAAGRCAADSHGDLRGADRGASRGKCGGDDSCRRCVSDPSGYGRVVRKSETQVGAIVEESQLTEEQRDINEINSSIYCFSLDKLWPALAQVKPNNKHKEIYLTDAVGVLAAKGETVLAQIAPDSREVLGCNTRVDLAEVDGIFREWKRNELMAGGVSIQLPQTVVVDPDVTAGEDIADRSECAAAGEDEDWRAVHRAHGQRAEGCGAGRRCDRRAALRDCEQPSGRTRDDRAVRAIRTRNQ